MRPRPGNPDPAVMRPPSRGLLAVSASPKAEKVGKTVIMEHSNNVVNFSCSVSVNSKTVYYIRNIKVDIDVNRYCIQHRMSNTSTESALTTGTTEESHLVLVLDRV